MAKKAKPISETVAAIHAHLSEVFADYRPPAPASADELQLLADAAGGLLPDELVELYRAGDGINLPEPVPELASLLSARDAREETERARADHGGVKLVILEHQDFESAVRAVALEGELAGRVARWESVEGHFEDYDETSVPDFLASYLTALQEALPTPKQLKAAIARVAKAGRAGDLRGVNSQFERSGRPGHLLRALLDAEPDAPNWISPEYGSHVLDVPLRTHSDDVAIPRLMAVVSRLRFAGTVTLLDGMSPLMHTLMATAYLRDPDATASAAASLTGIAKDSWLLLQRRIGTIPVSAVSEDLRARLVATPRKYQVYTPRDGRLEESSCEGVAGLEPYFESREAVISALRRAPVSSCARPEIIALHLEDASTPARVAAIYDAAVDNVAGEPDALWHRVAFRTLVDAAKIAKHGNALAWLCVGHPDAAPGDLEELAPVMQPPDDPADLARLPVGLAAAIAAKMPA